MHHGSLRGFPPLSKENGGGYSLARGEHAEKTLRMAAFVSFLGGGGRGRRSKGAQRGGRLYRCVVLKGPFD